MQDFSNLEYRKAILKEIFSAENKQRKAESFRRMEINNDRLYPYLVKALEDDGFEKDTVQGMRKIASINISPRIADKMAAVYQQPPTRTFETSAGDPLSDEVQNYLASVYKIAQADPKMLRSNRMKKYHNQCVAQVVPNKLKGALDIRILHPHQLDCVPMADDPEVPFGFIVSSFDRSQAVRSGDGVDQSISDSNDGEQQKLKAMRLVWWSAAHNIITDGLGDVAQDDPSDIQNPIQRLPFVDISDDKENEFWVRKGSPLIDFSVDYAVALSDTATTNRMQSFAQPIISSVEKPKSLRTGPMEAMWLPQDPNSTVQPEFMFANPNPDLNASLDFLDRLVTLFMTSRGIDPKTVASKSEGRTFSSGLERLLAMVEEFDASRDEIEYYRWVEADLFELIVLWTNAFHGTIDSPLKVKPPRIPDDARLNVQFATPEMIQTKAEIEDSEIKLMEKGLRSAVMVLQKIDGVSEDQAIETIKKIQEHKALFQEPKPELPTQVEAPEASADDSAGDE